VYVFIHFPPFFCVLFTASYSCLACVAYSSLCPDDGGSRFLLNFVRMYQITWHLIPENSYLLYWSSWLIECDKLITDLNQIAPLKLWTVTLPFVVPYMVGHCGRAGFWPRDNWGKANSWRPSPPYINIYKKMWSFAILWQQRVYRTNGGCIARLDV
jgi:hypothetical protein